MLLRYQCHIIVLGAIFLFDYDELQLLQSLFDSILHGISDSVVPRIYSNLFGAEIQAKVGL